MKPKAAEPGWSRRHFLNAAAAAAGVIVVDRAVFCPREAWALEAKGLQPATIQTLIKLARDIYPHDRLSDLYYGIAVKDFDGKAQQDAAARQMYEDGVTALDALAASAHSSRYVEVGWEADRVALLRQIEHGPFFQAVRSGLVVSLYNQKEVWPSFGYEGPSAPLGGYIHRGFDDITWL